MSPNGSESVLLGIDVLAAEGFERLRGARVGLVAGAASVDRHLVSVIDRLIAADGVDVAALFGAEHGLRGEAQAGVPVDDAVDPETGLPVYSLYGQNKRPRPASLACLDALVIDLVDAGCRYWTFLYTMSYCLEAAAAAGITVIVLDRPNPITGSRVEGNLLDPAFSSFVGRYPLPIRTGLTFGEAARLFNQAFGIGARLEIVPCQGWRRTQWYDETGLTFVPPSPNTPTLETLVLYPGTCLVEGTNLSEGRGTTRPFEVIGAPWIHPQRLADRLRERSLPGVAFRPVYFTPTFGKHQGQVCGGVHIHVLRRDEVHAVRVGLHLLDALKAESGSEFSWISQGNGRPFVDLLAGTDRLRLHLEAGGDPDELLRAWESELDRFRVQAAEVALYPH